MSNLYFTFKCAVCGDQLDYTKDDLDDATRLSFEPCPKCLKSQAEDMIEAIEEVKVTPEQKFYDGLNAAVEIIKEGAGL